MARKLPMARKGWVTAIIACCMAFGTGHVMQTVLVEQTAAQSGTPNVPNPPEEALVPVVLQTPPAPRWPETFG